MRNRKLLKRIKNISEFALDYYLYLIPLMLGLKMKIYYVMI